MKKANISCNAATGKYLKRGDCFENCLSETFDKLIPSQSDEGWLIVLRNEVKKRASSQHVQDVLHGLFAMHISMNGNFAKKLELYDIVCPSCFVDTEIYGFAILQLCEIAGLVFIVSRRYHLSYTKMEIHFEVCHKDLVKECITGIIQQTIEY